MTVTELPTAQNRHHAPDLERATRAAAELLDALGADTTAPGLVDTPGRIARAYVEMLTPRPFTMTTFPNDEGYNELVLARDIPFTSLCEHHALPFSGVAHVGYLPSDRIVGLSKLARLQVQERLTVQIADLLQDALAPRGVGVVVDAEHSCMSLRGARVVGTRTVTSALRGIVRDDPRSRQELLALTQRT